MTSPVAAGFTAALAAIVISLTFVSDAVVWDRLHGSAIATMKDASKCSKMGIAQAIPQKIGARSTTNVECRIQRRRLLATDALELLMTAGVRPMDLARQAA
ncbi:hypothetical protein [Methylobacterium sp. sgz302542]|uniref:hypothetical protein n=1 Tax=Methylobacterium sp. sgz302542 TaxID=3418176 RepID=UPI003EB88CD9